MGNKIETIWEDVFIVKTHNIEENGKQTIIVQEILNQNYLLI